MARAIGASGIALSLAYRCPAVQEERHVRADYASRDIGPALAAVNQNGGSWELAGRLGRGAWGGAWRCRNAAGFVAVLKCVWDTDWRARLESASRAVDLLHVRGAPVPRFLSFGYATDVGTWSLQEMLGGSAVSLLDAGLAQDVIAFNSLQVDVDDASERLFDWCRYVGHKIAEDPAGELARAARHDVRLAEATAWLRDQPRGRASDVVHGDLLATQLLARDGRLVAVVDWDAAGMGERAQDLALLFYNAFAQADRQGVPVDDEVVSLIARAVSAGGDDAVFGRYLAWEALSAVGFVLAHNPRHVEWRASLAVRTLARYGELADVHELAALATSS
jgi:hypothetical protein